MESIPLDCKNGVPRPTKKKVRKLRGWTKATICFAKIDKKERLPHNNWCSVFANEMTSPFLFKSSKAFDLISMKFAPHLQVSQPLLNCKTLSEICSFVSAKAKTISYSKREKLFVSLGLIKAIVLTIC